MPTPISFEPYVYTNEEHLRAEQRGVCFVHSFQRYYYRAIRDSNGQLIAGFLNQGPSSLSGIEDVVPCSTIPELNVYPSDLPPPLLLTHRVEYLGIQFIGDGSLNPRLDLDYRTHFMHPFYGVMPCVVRYNENSMGESFYYKHPVSRAWRRCDDALNQAEDINCCPACQSTNLRTNDRCCHETCENDLCNNCTRDCSDCGAEHCHEHTHFCASCESLICSDCANTCNNQGCRGRVYCCDHVFTCGNCQETVCNSHEVYCETCDTQVCSVCHRLNHQHAAMSLEEYSNQPSPVILDYMAVPREWRYEKSSGEPGTLYLGVELEMNFNGRFFPEVYKSTTKHLKDKFIYKADGSIGQGAELVITPMTLQAYHNINLLGFFKELSRRGVRSYVENKCGLHVHASRSEINAKTLLNLQYFFLNNREFLRVFSKRTITSFQQWTNIPKCLGGNKNCVYPKNDIEMSEIWKRLGRYRALNVGPATVEFRLFRGTLNYERVKASLEFVDAIITFAKVASVASVRNQKFGLTRFLHWIETQKEYRNLIKYSEKVMERFSKTRVKFKKLSGKEVKESSSWEFVPQDSWDTVNPTPSEVEEYV